MKMILKIVTIILQHINLCAGLGGFVLVALFQITTLIFAGNGLEFIENRGQIVDMEGNLRPDILFVGDAGGAKIYLRKGAISYVLTMDPEYSGTMDNEEEENELETWNLELETIQTLRVHRVDMEFVNANVDAKTRVEEPTQGYFNYYLGHCPEGITGVKAYRKVIYENMYPNIDVVFYGGQDNPPLTPPKRGIPASGGKEGMEYDFLIKPGGSVEDIILRYKGTDGIEISAVDSRQSRQFVGTLISKTKKEKLKIKTTLGEMQEEMPEVYQIINGERVAIEAAYELQGNEVKIVVGDYDRSKTLIIDPWITYYGGSSLDYGLGTATDGSGNVLITGGTAAVSTDFPVSPGAFQTSHAGGGYDAFVVKFDAEGKRLWATYLGGSGYDYGQGIATDGIGNVLITGYTYSTDFPVTLGAFQTSQAGFGDVFVAKLDAAGKQIWATYYGGSGRDNYSGVVEGAGIATDGSNNVVIAGYTSSTDFPVTTGAFQTSYGGGGLFGGDAYVVKLDGNDGYPIWATYYGGTDREYAYGIATDGSRNVLIIGSTYSTDFPVTSGAFQTSYQGGLANMNGGDVFVVKLDPAGDTLWATYYGGSETRRYRGPAKGIVPCSKCGIGT